MSKIYKYNITTHTEAMPSHRQFSDFNTADQGSFLSDMPTSGWLAIVVFILIMCCLSQRYQSRRSGYDRLPHHSGDPSPTSLSVPTPAKTSRTSATTSQQQKQQQLRSESFEEKIARKKKLGQGGEKTPFKNETAKRKNSLNLFSSGIYPSASASSAEATV